MTPTPPPPPPPEPASPRDWPPPPPPGTTRRLRARDYLLLVLLCVALYGVGALSGRPLSVHEARVPQLAREMARGESNWLLPQSGGRPWLERPPLPHWFTAGSMLLFRRSDGAWAARAPAAVAGCAIVLLGSWMAARWFGREAGLLGGVVLATTYELYRYATLAEDDVYLGAVAVACVAMFVKAEWPADAAAAPGGIAASATPAGRFRAGGAMLASVGPRPWATTLFFALLGLTNLAKGPLVGALPIIAATGAFVLWNRDPRRISHYLWLWGILLFLALTVAWPWWALRHYPDVVGNWRFDYLGKVDEGVASAAAAHKWDEAPWYYVAMLPMALAPWSWAVVIGFVTTARRAWRTPGSAERFLWCWALGGVAILSLPARKHHHYLVPVVTPWAILAALGLLPVGRHLLAGNGAGDARAAPRPASRAVVPFGLPAAVALFLLRRKLPGGAASAAFLSAAWICCVWTFVGAMNRASPGGLVASVVTGFVLFAGWAQACVDGRDPVTLAESNFLRQVEATVPPGMPILVNADMGSLRHFGVQFRLQRPARLLHNLSYLQADDIAGAEVFLVTQARDQPVIERLGEVRVLGQASTFRPKESAGQRLTLFSIKVSPDLPRYPRPPYVGVMEAMGRKKGPWCGPEWPRAREPSATRGSEDAQ